MTIFQGYSKTLNDVSQALAGRPVTVIHEKPNYAGLSGCALNVKGSAFVYISPVLSDDDWLRVYLHEIAHIKTSFGECPSTIPQGKDDEYWRSVRRLQYAFNPEIKSMEDRAEFFVYLWLRWGERYYKNYARVDDERAVGLLRTLAHYKG